MGTEWKTDDMSLVAVLDVNDIGYDDIIWEGDTCWFVYDEKSPELLSIVQNFLSGECSVEPKRYNKSFGQIKRDAFGHPDAVRRRHQFAT